MVGEQDFLPKWYPDYRKSDTLMRIQFILDRQTDFRRGRYFNRV